MRNPLAAAAGLRPAPRATYYTGASYDRLNGDWVLSRLSANQVIRSDIQTLRNRARELVMNNSTASAIPAIYSENVVGEDGITFQAKIQSTRGLPKATVNARLEDAWYEWAEVGNCTVDRRLSWVDVQRQIVETEAVDGEVLLRHVEGFGNRWGYALQLLDPDQLDVFFNVPPGPGQNAIRMGVEEDEWGAPVAYHLWSAHPAEPEGKRRIRVPADEIEHLYIQRRPHQSRGVTWFAPFVFDLKMLGGYREAELVAARTASAKQGFLQQTADAAPPQKPQRGEEMLRWEASPGVIETLPAGYTFAQWDPAHPTTAFEAFDKANVRSIATAARIAYMSLSGDLNGTSYSSGRIGLLAERAVFRTMQKRLIERICQRVYRRWLRMALLAGLDVGTVDMRQLLSVEWHPRSFPWVDPQKDIDASLREVDAGVNTLTRIAAQKGLDFRRLVDERAEEIEYAKAKGVPIVISTGPKTSSASLDETAEPADASDGKSGAEGDGEDDSPKQKNPAPKNGNGATNGHAAHRIVSRLMRGVS